MRRQRVKRLIIPGELICDALRTGSKLSGTIKEGLPADAKIIGAYYGLRWPDELDIVLESEEFEEVDHGAEIPFLFFAIEQGEKK